MNKLVIRKSNKVVVDILTTFASVVPSAKHIDAVDADGNAVKLEGLGTDDYDIVDVTETLPSDFASGLYTWDGSAFAFNKDYPVPTSVTMDQATAALSAAGLLDDVETYMSTASAAEKIEWAHAHEIAYDSPVVAKLKTTLSLSDEQIMRLFITAADI